MRKTKWWLRIVGAFYLALVAMNISFLAANPAGIEDTIPFPVDENGLHAFIDAWFVFIFALAALGVVMLYASAKPAHAGMLVLAVVAGELAYGIAGDVWLIARGYDVASYVAFSVLHVVIAVTGVLLLRGELREPAALIPMESAGTAA